MAFSVSGLLPADDSPNQEKTPAKKEAAKKENKSERPDNLIPLYRFYNTRTNEHAYTHAVDEVEAWRNVSHVDEHFIVGDVSPMELPETIRLWRAIRDKDKKHYYYLRAPGPAVKLTVDDRAFKCYVWKKPGDGRVPVYATTWTDGTDVAFDPNLNNLRKFREDTKKALGTYRLSLGGRDFGIPVFYVYAHPSEETSEKPPAE